MRSKLNKFEQVRASHLYRGGAGGPVQKGGEQSQDPVPGCGGRGGGACTGSPLDLLNRMTDTTANMTFRQLRWSAVTNQFKFELELESGSSSVNKPQ